MNNNLLTSIATLPTGYIEYFNVLKSEGIIRTSYKNKRGVYLWTNQINGHQYIGSSINLSSRLSDYFTNSYLKYQSNRGSAISLAILKYGLSEFNLQIFVLGPSPDRDSISTISDLILLEQYYLDRYSLIYNLRRIAIGAAPISNSNCNKGKSNPQFDKKGPDAAAWDYKHSPEQKLLWSLTRSTPIFIYDLNILTFHSIIYGYERLAHFLGVHINTARRVAKSSDVYAKKYVISLNELTKQKLEAIKTNIKGKSTVRRVIYVYNKDKSILLKTFPSVNIFIKISKLNGSMVKLLCESDTLFWLDEYFISYNLIFNADNSLTNVNEFKPKLRDRKTSIPVYTYSADGTTFIKRYSSLRECVKDLDGNRNTNTNTLILRIEHKQLYHGFRVSYVPLFNHQK